MEPSVTKSRYLRVQFSDHSLWDIPLEFIADERAGYFVNFDKFAIYAEEYERGLSDDELLMEWADDKMDWSDVEAVAKQVASPDTASYEDEWPNARKTVVEY